MRENLLKRIFILPLLVALAAGGLILPLPQIAYAATVIILTTADTSPWSVPADWNNSSNTVEVVGAGGNGAAGTTALGGGGGGGGAYAKVTNLSLTPGGTAPFQIGVGGSGTATWFSSSATVDAGAGTNASGATKGNGGTVGAGTGFAGGAGGSGSASVYRPGAGGGGAGGPLGAGGAGGNSVATNGYGGAGGGGNGGGTAGSSATSKTGGNGGNDQGGTGQGVGTTGIGGNGSSGGGGAGGAGTSSSGGAFAGGSGSLGTEWTGAGTGGGGGGGGGDSRTSGGGNNGGAAGAPAANTGAGGGGGGSGKSAGGAASSGSAGFIIITYTPSTSAPTVTTNFAGAVDFQSANLVGAITNTGGANPTTEGFAYGTSANLSTVIATTSASGSFGTGPFNTGIGGLSPSITYYFRAYATNTAGTGYGSILNFTTGDSTPSRMMRLFEGFVIKLFTGKIILFGS